MHRFSNTLPSLEEAVPLVKLSDLRQQPM